jgi:multisubunit Na+/H+ antiporter MnhB subunit
MPPHPVLASATLVATGIAALLSLGYAWSPRVRRALRWPLLATAIAATLGVVVAATAGSSLLHDLEKSAGSAEVAAAQAHGHSADGFAVAVLCLLVVVLATIWSTLRPGRERWSAGMWFGAALLSATAIATIITGGQVLNAALDAVALKYSI